MTYGQIARVMDDRYSPRLVGWAMHATPRDGREIPWHRVINSRGTVSTGRIILDQPDLQRLLLEAEGITFDDKGRCDLDRYQWSPSTRKARAVVRLARGGSKQLSKNRKVPSRPAKRSRKGVRT
jgi:methylated-DNA-protein-cysteine methyltransferase-like protein